MEQLVQGGRGGGRMLPSTGAFLLPFYDFENAFLLRKKSEAEKGVVRASCPRNHDWQCCAWQCCGRGRLCWLRCGCRLRWDQGVCGQQRGVGGQRVVVVAAAAVRGQTGG